MAKNPRGAKNGDQAEPPSAPPVLLPTPAKLKSLMKQHRDAKANLTDIASDLSTATRGMVENNHLHVKAFNMCKALDRMSPEKLAEWADHFFPYYDMLGLADRAKTAQRLPLEGESEDTKDQGKGPPGTGKSGEGTGGTVTSFPGARPN